MLYLVKAVDKQGRDQEFMVEEVDARAAAASISSRGFFPFEVTECPPQKDEPLSRFKPESIKPCVQPEPQSAVLTCHACTNIMAKSLKKCPHCGAPRKPTAQEQQVSNIAALGCLIPAILFVILIAYSCSITPSSSRSYSSPRRTEHSDYKSTKPVREMDGWERKEIDDAWDTISPEEKRKQIYRDFGDIVDIQE